MLIVGPVPPPLNGMTVMTAHALEACRSRELPHIHLDISDHRAVGNVGRLDARNVLLAFQHTLRMHRMIRRHRPRLVYLPIAQGTLGFLRDWLFFLVARGHRLPVVVHLHGAAFGDFYESAGTLMRWVIRTSLAKARVAIVLGDSLRNVFGGLIDPSRVEVVANGIPDVPRFVAEERRTNPVQILFLSNLSRAKGYSDLLAAAGEVVRRHPEAKFTFAGEWPREADARAARKGLQQLGLEGRARFIPSVSGIRKHQLFLRSDIFVFPPRQLEGQPVVLLEAMGYGLPVITTPRGGIVDTVVPDRTGLFVPPENPGALAEAICALVESPERRTAMGAAGRRLYEERFSAEAFRSSLARVLAGALSAPADSLEPALEGR